MGKLHELLAVEPDKEGYYKLALDEARTTFKNKPTHFTGMHKTCVMLKEGDVAPPDEHLEMTTTVKDKLLYIEKAIVDYLDVVLQKESTNQEAKADLVVDGQVLATQLPATFLLGLESKLKTIRAVYAEIPTLAPGIAWKHEPTLGPDVYKTEKPEEKLKTAKTFMFKVLYQATDKHPAQIEKWEEQVPVGRYITETFSGMLSPAEKSELLARIDKLIQAAKVARQQANSVEASKREVGEIIMRYINR